MSFSMTSQDIQLEGTTLVATCQTMDGDWSSSVLDLNEGIANIDGVLKWQWNGNFAASSKNLCLDGNWLKCQSRTMSGEWVDAQINLDECVTNNNGNLQFQNL